MNAEAYWESQLTDDLPFGNWPIASPERGRRDKAVEVIETEFSEKVSEKIEKITRSSQRNLLILGVAITKILLTKYSRHKSSLVCVPSTIESGVTLGHLLPLRSEIDENRTFKEILLEVRESYKKALEYAFPVENILYRKGMIGSREVNPYFHTVVAVGEYGGSNICDVESLNVSFRCVGKKYSLKINYDVNVFDQQHCESLVRCFGEFTSNALENIDEEVSRINILSDHDQKHQLLELSRRSIALPSGDTLVSLFMDSVENFSDACAVICGDESYSYNELNLLSIRLARVLKMRGCSKGDAVVVYLEKSINTIASFIGILRQGGAYVPISCKTPLDRLKAIVSEGNVKYVVSDSIESKDAIDWGVDLIDPRSCLTFGDNEFEDDVVQILPSDLAYIIYTSGSTGTPKGVEVEHHSILSYVNWKIKHYGFDRETVNLQLLSFAFDSSQGDLFPVLLTGGTLVLVPEREITDVRKNLELIKKYKVTYFGSIPSLYSLFLEEMSEAYDHLKGVNVAGEYASVQLAQLHYEKLPNTLLTNEYGPAENSVGATFYNFPKGNVENTFIGKPLDNTRIYILDENLQLMPPGAVGEIFLGGGGVARGYRCNSRLTREKFLDDPFELNSRIYRTGDLGRWSLCGNLEFIGRVDHQVKVRGQRLEIGELEKAMMADSRLREVVVAPYEQKKGEIDLVAYVKSAEPVSELELRKMLVPIVPNSLIPNYFVFVDDFDRSQNGKIDRSVLPSPLECMKPQMIEEVVAKSGLEKEIRDVFCEVLGVTSIGRSVNIFSIGGNSLKIARIVLKLSGNGTINCTIRQLLENPTIASFAESIEEGECPQLPIVKELHEKDYYRLSPSQESIWISSEIFGENRLFNIHDCFIIERSIDVRKLEAAFYELVDQNEAFRTRFLQVNGEPRQKILERSELVFEYSYIDRVGVEECELKKLSDIERGFEFDLEKGPLLRVKLISFPEERHFLMLTTHHIVCDGVSMEIIADQVWKFYDKEASRRISDRRPRYVDYAEWHHEVIEGIWIEPSKRYWRKKLDGFKGSIAIESVSNTNISRSEGINGRLVEVNCGSDLRDDVFCIGNRHSVSPFIVWISALATSVHLESGSDDIVVGFPFGGRICPNTENMIGCFVNPVALRLKYSRSYTFGDVLNVVNKTSLEAFDHQLLSYNQIYDQWRKTEPGRINSQLVRYGLTWHDMTQVRLGTPLFFEGEAFAKYDMWFHILEFTDQIRAFIEFNPAKISECKALEVFQLGNELIRIASHSPDVKLSDSLRKIRGPVESRRDGFEERYTFS